MTGLQVGLVLSMPRLYTMDLMESSKPLRRQDVAVMFPNLQASGGCPLCVVCRAELRRKDGLPRRAGSRYCSRRCVDESWVKAGVSARIRQLLLERDEGICKICGLDCERLRLAFEDLGLSGRVLQGGALLLYTLPPSQAASWRDLEWCARLVRDSFTARAVTLGWDVEQHTWEAHHVVPVVEGGGGCGLEGYATLCLRCHKRVNAELAARRARPSGDGEPAGQMGLPFP